MTEPIEPDDLAAWSRELAPQPDENGHITYTPEPTPVTEEVEVGDDDEPIDMAAVRKIRREAANLRARMHELEEQLGAAAARETARDRAEVERIAGEHLVDPGDIWRAQPDLTAYYDGEFHEITRDRVIETAMALAREKPHLARPQAAPPPTDRPLEGLRSGAAPEVKEQPISWSSALHGR